MQAENVAGVATPTHKTKQRQDGTNTQSKKKNDNVGKGDNVDEDLEDLSESEHAATRRTKQQKRC